LIQILPRLIDNLARYANYLALISLVAMTLLICVEVFSRTLLGVSTLVGEEWPSYMLVAVVFLGLATTYKENAFIIVEIVFVRLRKSHQKALRFACLLLAIVFVILFDYQLISFVASSYFKGSKSISFSETPLFIPQVAMPIGMTLLGLQLIKDAVLTFLSLRISMGD
jgi:TRAP-type C4-dicarboxylate transport system permease small subunit